MIPIKADLISSLEQQKKNKKNKSAIMESTKANVSKSAEKIKGKMLVGQGRNWKLDILNGRKKSCEEQ